MRFSTFGPALLVFIGGAALLADTQDSVRRSIPAQSGGRVTLTAQLGSIQVRTQALNSVDVEVYFRGNPPSRAEFERMLRDFALEVDGQGADIHINGRFKNGWVAQPFGGFWGSWHWCNNGRCLEYGWLRQVEFRVYVPAKFNVDLNTSGGSISVADLGGEATARTSGGSLSFGKIDGPVNGRTSGGSISLAGGRGKAVLRTSGGSIHVDDVTGEVSAETSGGSIEVGRVSGRVVAHTSGGGIRIRQASGAVDASTSGGSISAFLDRQPPESCRLETAGGGINVQLAGNIGMNVEASTSGGTVSTDFPVPTDRTHHSLHAAINGGGPALVLHTSGGGISIQRAH